MPEPRHKPIKPIKKKKKPLRRRFIEAVRRVLSEEAFDARKNQATQTARLKVSGKRRLQVAKKLTREPEPEPAQA